MKKIALALFAVSYLISSCAGMQVGEGEKGQVGAIGGATAGAIIGQAIGHNTEATLIGAAVGGLVGYIIGNEMDKYDRQQLNHVYERGVSNQTAAWVNPDTGNRYMVTPKSAYNPTPDKICRKAEVEAWIDGKRETTYTTACRDQHGNWQLQ